MMRRDEYVKKIKEYSGVSLQDIRAVMKAMQKICIEAVKNDDAIFVIDGIKVFSKMIPEQEKNIFGEYNTFFLVSSILHVFLVHVFSRYQIHIYNHNFQ